MIFPGLTSLACEPIPILFYMWGGAAMDALLLAKTASALVIVVAIKAILFSSMAKMGAVRGIAAMVIANIVSTIPGVIIGVFMASSALFFVGLVILAIAAQFVGQRFCTRYAPYLWGWLTPGRFLLWSLVCGFAGALMAVFWNLSISDDNALVFLAYKALALFVGLLGSIAMTIGWEASVVAAFIRPEDDPRRVLRAVVTANLVTFLIVATAGALLALPHRLRRSDFLWWYSVPQ